MRPSARGRWDCLRFDGAGNIRIRILVWRVLAAPGGCCSKCSCAPSQVVGRCKNCEQAASDAVVPGSRRRLSLVCGADHDVGVSVHYLEVYQLGGISPVGSTQGLASRVSGPEVNRARGKPPPTQPVHPIVAALVRAAWLRMWRTTFGRWRASVTPTPWLLSLGFEGQRWPTPTGPCTGPG